MDIDLYCERVQAGAWAEPLNTLSNFGFFFAALFAFILARREGRQDWRSLLLILFVFAIGLGSTAFHLYGTRQTLLLDVLPILIFQLSFLGLYLLDVRRLSRTLSTFFLALYLLLTLTVGRADILPQGSSGYLPALLMLGGLAYSHFQSAGRERYILLIAALTFCVSLAFRSMDEAICPTFPVGTHFVWHILNAVVLYLCVRSYLMAKTSNQVS